MAQVLNTIRKTVTRDFGFGAADVPDLKGRVALITGGTNGIGLSVSRTVYSHGARVVLLSSQQDVGNAAVEYIKSGDLSKAPQDYRDGFRSNEKDTSDDKATEPGEVEFIKCDFSDLTEVASVSKSLSQKLVRLDYFFGLAGLGVGAFSRTKHGYDSHITINCLAEHLLLSHVWPNLSKTAAEPGTDVRVATMSSEMHRMDFASSDFTDIETFKKDVGGTSLYSRTKLGNILFGKAVTQRHIKPSSSPILLLATHPGGVRTGQQSQFSDAYGALGGALGSVVRGAMREPDKGACSILWAAFSPAARDPKEGWESGDYLSDPGEDGKENKPASDQKQIDAFYDNSEKIIVEIVGQDGYGNWSSK